MGRGKDKGKRIGVVGDRISRHKIKKAAVTKGVARKGERELKALKGWFTPKYVPKHRKTKESKCVQWDQERAERVAEWNKEAAKRRTNRRNATQKRAKELAAQKQAEIDKLRPVEVFQQAMERLDVDNGYKCPSEEPPLSRDEHHEAMNELEEMVGDFIDTRYRFQKQARESLRWALNKAIHASEVENATAWKNVEIKKRNDKLGPDDKPEPLKRVRTLFHPHGIIYGLPGTGKSNLARLLLSMYTATGIVPRGHGLAIVDSGELVSQYLNATPTKVRERLAKEAKESPGGKLGAVAADELSKVIAMLSRDTNPAGEIVATLMESMDRAEDPLVVFLFVLEEHKDILAQCLPGGAERRFNECHHLDAYTQEHVAAMFWEEITSSEDPVYELPEGITVKDIEKHMAASITPERLAGLNAAAIPMMISEIQGAWTNMADKEQKRSALGEHPVVYTITRAMIKSAFGVIETKGLSSGAGKATVPKNIPPEQAEAALPLCLTQPRIAGKQVGE